MAASDTIGVLVLGGTSGSDTASARKIVYDSSGNKIVAGLYNGLITLSPTVSFTNTAGASKIFVAKFNPAGTLLWAASFGIFYNLGVTGLEVDSSGNVFLEGFFQFKINFYWNASPTPYPSDHDRISQLNITGVGYSFDNFIVKLDGSNGNWIWDTEMGSDGNEVGGSLAVDKFDNNPVFVGFLWGSNYNISNGGGSLTPVGSNKNLVILKLNGSDGSIIYKQNYGNSSSGAHCVGWAVASLTTQGVILTGNFVNSIVFGTTTLTATGYQDLFLLKLDASGGITGTPVSFGSGPGGTPGTIEPHAIDVNASGSIAVDGLYVNGTANLGGTTFPVPSTAAMFVVVYNMNAGHIWSKTFGGGLGDASNLVGVVLDDDGKAIIVGTEFNSIDFGGGAIYQVPVTQDAVIACFDTDGTYKWASRYGGSGADFGWAVALLSSANAVCLAGSFVVQLNCSPGSSDYKKGTTIAYAGGPQAGPAFLLEISTGTFISPPNPADFTAVYAPSSNTSFQSKFGFNWGGTLPAGASNILIKYLFPTGTIFPTPNVETTPFLLLNYVSPNLYNGKTAYGFVYKVTGGNGPLWNIPLGYTTIQDWQWAAAWADSTGAQLGSYTAWQPVTRTAAVNLKNDGNIANTPYGNLRTTTIRTIKGPMQVVS